MSDAIEDWPVHLPPTATTLWLAKKLHCAVADTYGDPFVPWDGLPADVRRRYLLSAANALQAHVPIPTRNWFDIVVGSARAEAARVLAKITPATPWGEPEEKGK